MTTRRTSIRNRGRSVDHHVHDLRERPALLSGAADLLPLLEVMLGRLSELSPSRYELRPRSGQRGITRASSTAPRRGSPAKTECWWGLVCPRDSDTYSGDITPIRGRHPKDDSSRAVSLSCHRSRLVVSHPDKSSWWSGTGTGDISPIQGSRSADHSTAAYSPTPNPTAPTGAHSVSARCPS
jgi:hypothetical protein